MNERLCRRRGWNTQLNAFPRQETYLKQGIKSAANRSYYAVFHAMRAVLAFDEIDMKHHSGIISEFRKRYIKAGAFDTSLSGIISELSSVREGSDYNDFFIVSKAETIQQVQSAEEFLAAIQSYLSAQY
jgi:uncharacterized protein (UPF0332 family)